MFFLHQGKESGAEISSFLFSLGKGSSSISSDVSSSTDHTPTQAQKNVATSEVVLVQFKYGKHYDCKILLLELKVPARSFEIGTPGIRDFDNGKVIVV
ncbi:hypothetical protein MG293_014229 [Ovis ammon polii]|uniref:Uncharacterized protein n=1 Tax=Ovis ammon polii TaxID=230172 RepID=A0AAD4Y669_OVIAM|nr:hypothetical protein MG293_014229 [Ovis ammon polii]